MEKKLDIKKQSSLKNNLQHRKKIDRLAKKLRSNIAKRKIQNKINEKHGKINN